MSLTDTLPPPSPSLVASRRRPRWARWLRRLAALVAGVIILAGSGLVVVILTSPGVANAAQRVQAILVAHHTPGDNGAIPTRLAAALLATEDSRYYHDPALDPRGVGRAVLGVVTHNGRDGGATIERQLAKMLYARGLRLGQNSDR